MRSTAAKSYKKSPGNKRFITDVDKALAIGVRSIARSVSTPIFTVMYFVDFGVLIQIKALGALNRSSGCAIKDWAMSAGG